MRFAFKTAIAALLLSGCISLGAEEKQPQGFLTIPFGATRDAWLTELKARFNFKPSFALGLYQWPMSGSGMELLQTSENIYCLKDYKLGNRLYTVLFYFTADGKFYGFRLKGDKDLRSRKAGASAAFPKQKCESGLTSNESQDLLEDVDFLQKVFETKYGTPTKVQNYSDDEICQNAGRIFWVLRSSRYLAAVGTVQTIRLGINNNRASDMFSTIAVVYDSKLRGELPEGASIMAPEGSLRSRVERKLIGDAAGSF